MAQQQFYKKIDTHGEKIITSLVIILFAFGALTLYSALIKEALVEGTGVFSTIFKQLLFISVGIFFLFFTRIIKIRKIEKASPYIYGVSFLAMLGLLTPFAVTVNNATRWLSLGSFQFQPSELFKIGTILIFAYILSKNMDLTKKIVVGVFVWVSVFFFAVIQPDYGFAFVLTATLYYMFLLIKVPATWKIYLTILLVAAFLFVVFQIDYVGKRFQPLFSNDSTVQLDSGFHRLQTIQAIQNGGLFGVGIGEGEKKFSVPELQTDSIFTVVAEETGFFGSSILVALFMAFLFLCAMVIRKSTTEFGYFAGVGLVFLLGFEIFLNIFVTLGIVPATGIPLLFFSVGGTSIITTCIAIGILLSIGNVKKSTAR